MYSAGRIKINEALQGKFESIENSKPNPVLEIVVSKFIENSNPNPVLEIVVCKFIENSKPNPVLEIAITTKMRSRKRLRAGKRMRACLAADGYSFDHNL